MQFFVYFIDYGHSWYQWVYRKEYVNFRRRLELFRRELDQMSLHLTRNVATRNKRGFCAKMGYIGWDELQWVHFHSFPFQATLHTFLFLFSFHFIHWEWDWKLFTWLKVVWRGLHLLHLFSLALFLSKYFDSV